MRYESDQYFKDDVTRAILRNLRIFILEREYSGHRLTVVRVLLEALIELDQQQCLSSITLATTEEAVNSSEFDEQLTSLRDYFTVEYLPPRIQSTFALAIAWQKLWNYLCLVNSGRYDHGYVPYGDGLIQLLALCRLSPLRWWANVSIPVETILMRGTFAYPESRPWTRLIAMLSLHYAPFFRIHLIDPLAHRFVRQRHPEHPSSVVLLPDPISETQKLEKVLARRELKLPLQGRLLGCVGMIDERKGVDRLIHAFMTADLKPDDRLLLAGRQNETLRAIINTLNDPRILTVNRYLTEDELSLAINSLDLVVTPYPAFIGSASIVIRAAAAGRPSLSSNTGWTGYVIPTFELGQTCNVLDRKELAQQLTRSLNTSGTFQLTPKAEQFVVYGMIGNVNAHWCAGIRARLSLTCDARFRTWPDNEEL